MVETQLNFNRAFSFFFPIRREEMIFSASTHSVIFRCVLLYSACAFDGDNPILDDDDDAIEGEGDRKTVEE